MLILLTIFFVVQRRHCSMQGYINLLASGLSLSTYFSISAEEKDGII